MKHKGREREKSVEEEGGSERATRLWRRDSHRYSGCKKRERKSISEAT